MRTHRALVSGDLPPRARRILDFAGFDRLVHGTTSACAENTHTALYSSQARWNYLRVRGEYSWARRAGQEISELPPRARRILDIATGLVLVDGTTSACAENTLITPANTNIPRNYLRVRGEYFARSTGSVQAEELPPRARRIRH